MAGARGRARGVRFRRHRPPGDDPRYLRVPLQPHGEGLLEVWRTHAPVERGRDGDIAGRATGNCPSARSRVAEGEGGIVAAAEHAYSRLTRFIADSPTPHLLRIWNYLDAITEGEGDAERYRQFCVGARARARCVRRADPAGRDRDRPLRRRARDPDLLARRGHPGTPVENPRQVSAYRYPRQYGPQPPSFARAMLPPPGSAMPLLLSGTASVVGHRSLHAGRLLAQLDETFANFDSLIGAAREHAPALPARFGRDTQLKVYVREREDLPLVAEAFADRFGGGVPHLILHAVICRRDLAIEIDGVKRFLPAPECASRRRGLLQRTIEQPLDRGGTLRFKQGFSCRPNHTADCRDQARSWETHLYRRGDLEHEKATPALLLAGLAVSACLQAQAAEPQATQAQAAIGADNAVMVGIDAKTGKLRPLTATEARALAAKAAAMPARRAAPRSRRRALPRKPARPFAAMPMEPCRCACRFPR